MKHITKSTNETFELAQKYARHLKSRDVLALEGELGAGKTRFVQGLAAGLGVPEKVYVRSPSFALLNEYNGGRLTLFHFDFYRLEREDELLDLGIEEYIDANGITVIEWADRFPGALPDRTRHIRFHIVDDDIREITFVR
ncbi:MAG: tRNA (adenosine(37)-N6)-threonylcarbamoyltransferase complex ATPase subunit type 1 TsaE [bacterium]